MRFLRTLGAASSGAGIATVALAGIVLGATIVVTPGSGGWTEDATVPPGEVTFTTEYGDPDSTTDGSVELTTGGPTDTAAKAGLYNHSMLGTPIDEVATLSYWTYQAVGGTNPPHADASYQLQVDVNGDAAGGFTTFVFEPYQNVDQGPIIPGEWQVWDVDEGQFWSSRTVSDSAAVACTFVAGAGGAPFYTLEYIQTSCPDAVVVGIGFNIGTFNPGWTVAVDLMQFNDTIWDFEVTNEPENSDDCKDGGWESLTDEDGEPFRNQGDCVASVHSGKG